MGDLFDLHSTCNRGHDQEVTVGAVEQNRHVILLGDGSGLRDHHLMNGVTLNIHSKNCLSLNSGICCIEC
jgi:hypothetical protein